MAPVASSVYWVAGAACGLAEGYAYAVEQLCPGGAALVARLGLHPHKRAEGAVQDAAAGRGGDQAGPSARHSLTDDTAAAAGARGRDVGGGGGGGAPGARQPSSFPVDDLAPYASSASLADIAGLVKESAAAAGAGAGAGAAASGVGGAAAAAVPKLKIAPRGSRADVEDVPDASAAAAAPTGPAGARDSRLTEQNIGPFNAAYEAARRRGWGGGAGGGAGTHGGGEEGDAMTIATMNRYTYGMGPEYGVAAASAPVTPRSGASDSVMGAHKKKAGLFRGLRRKGQKPNQQLR